MSRGSPGARNPDFRVALAVANGQEVAVSYATSEGTATVPDDNGATRGTPMFAAGM